MSDAVALQATEQCRDLVAKPEQWGLKKRAGLEPLDVSVKFNRLGHNTKQAFQVIVQMKITLDEGVTWRDEAALVGQGRTKGEALEMFYNWLADDNAMATFHAVVKAHEAKKLDALAEAELAKQAAASKDQAGRAKEFNRKWVDRKLDDLGRTFGFVKRKVQV